MSWICLVTSRILAFSKVYIYFVLMWVSSDRPTVRIRIHSQIRTTSNRVIIPSTNSLEVHTLTENPDGQWTAYGTATEQVSQGRFPEETLENLDGAAGVDTSARAVDRGDDDVPPSTIAKAINAAEESDCEAGALDANLSIPTTHIFPRQRSRRANPPTRPNGLLRCCTESRTRTNAHRYPTATLYQYRRVLRPCR